MLNNLLRKTSDLGVVSWGILKIGLLTAGILLGAYFSEFFLGIIPLLWAIAVISFVYLGYFFFIRK